jgi:hypothetical protein
MCSRRPKLILQDGADHLIVVVVEAEEVDQGVEHLVVVVVEDEDSKRVDQGYRQKRTNKLSSFDIIAVTYYADSYESKEMRSC